MKLVPEHISGLVVGEGCFYAESCADPKYRSGWRIRPAFCIEMRHEEREVLEEVARQLGCGRIYDLDFGRYRGYETKGWESHVKLRVSNLSDLHELILPFFRKHELFGRKRMAFDTFAELVELLHARKHLTPSGLKDCKAVAAHLAEHNRRGRSAPSTRRVVVNSGSAGAPR
jgi:LAGLIDADG DNA endonuclease family protein